MPMTGDVEFEVPWPASRDELIALQEVLAAAKPEPWHPSGGPVTVGGCFVCFERGESGPGAARDRGWAAAALVGVGPAPVTAVVVGITDAGYEPGLLALREGRLLEIAVRGLPQRPD